MSRVARTSIPVQSPGRWSAWTALLFVLRLGGLMPFSAWFALCLLVGAWYAFEIHIARPPMFWMGEPKPLDGMNPFTWTRTLRNQGFMLGYSDLKGNPLWATYALTPPPQEAESLPPHEGFQADWRGLSRVVPDDFNRSGYECGHLVPRHSIGLVYGESGQRDAALMTNATPQKSGLHAKLWERLEDLELDPFAKQFGKIWVMSGPIFDPPQERLHTSRRVDVPSAFFKIIVAPEEKKMLALVIPQTVRGDEPLEHYLTSVDAIEKRTGFDFFPDLADADEDRLEAAVDPEPWHLHELARRRTARKAVERPAGDTIVETNKFPVRPEVSKGKRERKESADHASMPQHERLNSTALPPGVAPKQRGASP